MQAKVLAEDEASRIEAMRNRLAASSVLPMKSNGDRPPGTPFFIRSP